MLETVATSRVNINLFVHSLNISVFWNSDGPETTDCRGSNHVMDLPAQDRLLNCLVRFCFARKKTSFSFLVAAKKICVKIIFTSSKGAHKDSSFRI